VARGQHQRQRLQNIARLGIRQWQTWRKGVKDLEKYWRLFCSYFYQPLGLFDFVLFAIYTVLCILYYVYCIIYSIFSCWVYFKSLIIHRLSGRCYRRVFYYSDVN
jgi:hypothetical protein